MMYNLVDFPEQTEATKQYKNINSRGGKSSFNDSITPHFILLTRSKSVGQTGVSMGSV